MDEFKANDFFTSEDNSDFLGRGSYASVRRCHHKDLGNVVVKCFNIGGSKTTIDRTSDDLQNEAKVLFRLQHENIIKVLGVTRWRTCCGIVMEEAAGYNMEDLFLSKKIRDIPWPLRSKFLMEIANGLEYLHCHNKERAYVHGDLKLQNILLSDNLVVKIADFGAVSLVQASGSLSASFSIVPNKQHTWLYSAPELLNNPSTKRTCALDVYSYALIGYEIITRHQVFVSSGCPNYNLIQQLIRDEGLKPDQELFNEVKSNLVDESDLDICYGLESIMIECWQTNPKDRLSIKEVKSKLERIDLVIANRSVEIAHLKQTKNLNKSKKVSLNQFDFPFQVALYFIQSSSADVEISNSIVNPKTIQVKYLVLLNQKTNC